MHAGWGYTHVDASGTPRGAQRGRQRPAKHRKGRALKGNKRAKGKSGRAGWDDEDDIAASEVPLVDPYGRVPGVPLAAPVVEGIFGWRWPLPQQNFDRSATHGRDTYCITLTGQMVLAAAHMRADEPCDVSVLESEQLGPLSCGKWQQHCYCQPLCSAAIASPYAQLVCWGQCLRWLWILW